MDEVLKRLENLERFIESQSINTKEVLNFYEACPWNCRNRTCIN